MEAASAAAKEAAAAENSALVQQLRDVTDANAEREAASARHLALSPAAAASAAAPVARPVEWRRLSAGGRRRSAGAAGAFVC